MTDDLTERTTPRRWTMGASERFALWLLSPTLVLLAALTLYPFFYSVKVSFFGYAYGKPAGFAWFANYAALVKDKQFLGAIWTTGIYTVVAVGLEFLLGLGLAMLVASIKGRSAALAKSVFILPMMLPPVVVGLMWRLLYTEQIGVINYFASFLRLGPFQWLASEHLALPAIIVVDIWQWTPFMFLILLAGWQSLPLEPFEAAWVDGATPWRVFRDLTLPMLKPAIVVALLFRTIDALRVFDQIFVLTHGGPGTATETLSIYIYKTAFKFWQIGYAAAMLFVVMVLIDAISMLYLRLLGTSRVKGV